MYVQQRPRGSMPSHAKNKHNVVCIQTLQKSGEFFFYRICCGEDDLIYRWGFLDILPMVQGDG